MTARRWDLTPIPDLPDAEELAALLEAEEVVIVEADRFQAISGTTMPGTGNCVLAFDKDADEGACAFITLPPSWNTASLYVATYNAFGAGLSGDVRWTLKAYPGGATVTTNITVAMPAAGVQGTDLLATITPVDFAGPGGQGCRVDLIRDADHADDNFGGDAYVMALIAAKAT